MRSSFNNTQFRFFKSFHFRFLRPLSRQKQRNFLTLQTYCASLSLTSMAPFVDPADITKLRPITGKPGYKSPILVGQLDRRTGSLNLIIEACRFFWLTTARFETA
jgi:hypothetical protein